jgi:hypothetical protein
VSAYTELRRRVLDAGGFSVFDATETQAKARLFDRLARDPSIWTMPRTFPWTEVRQKEGQ